MNPGLCYGTGWSWNRKVGALERSLTQELISWPVCYVCPGKWFLEKSDYETNMDGWDPVFDDEVNNGFTIGAFPSALESNHAAPICGSIINETTLKMDPSNMCLLRDSCTRRRLSFVFVASYINFYCVCFQRFQDLCWVVSWSRCFIIRAFKYLNNRWHLLWRFYRKWNVFITD